MLHVNSISQHITTPIAKETQLAANIPYSNYLVSLRLSARRAYPTTVNVVNAQSEGAKAPPEALNILNQIITEYWLPREEYSCDYHNVLESKSIFLNSTKEKLPPLSPNYIVPKPFKDSKLSKVKSSQIYDYRDNKKYKIDHRISLIYTTNLINPYRQTLQEFENEKNKVIEEQTDHALTITTWKSDPSS